MKVVYRCKIQGSAEKETENSRYRQRIEGIIMDRYTTQTVLKPSGRFYKRLAGFKTGWPDLIHYVHPGPL